MARLAAYAMKNDVFRKVVSTKTHTVPGNDVRKHDLNLRNSTRLISASETSRFYYEYAIGGKTGATSAGGNCQIAMAMKDGHLLIVSLMGARLRDGESHNGVAGLCFLDAIELFEKAYTMLDLSDNDRPKNDRPVCLQERSFCQQPRPNQ
jgi:D-alanyl-D-alanine carboxypeptidase